MHQSSNQHWKQSSAQPRLMRVSSPFSACARSWTGKISSTCTPMRKASASLSQKPDAFGVDPDKDFVHARESARILKAWSNAKTQAETKQYVDNIAKAHGEPTTMLQVDWTTLLDRFEEKYGEHLHDNRLPSQS